MNSSDQVDVDPCEAAREAAENGDPTANLIPTKTSSHRQTEVQGDGDAREGEDYLDGLATPQDRSIQFCRVDLKNIQWHFCGTENPHDGKQYPGFALPVFVEQSRWIDRKCKEARAELKFASEWLRIMESRRRQAVMEGLRRQVQHAAYLARLVKGWILKPWGSSWSFWEDDNPIASALLHIYGPDPVPAFLRAMREHGIVPFDPDKIGAGNVLHTFHVRGDPKNTLNGWAILHRCPGAGTFGSWRTGRVYCWHSRPEQMDDARAQFVNDYRRATQKRSEKKIAA